VVFCDEEHFSRKIECGWRSRPEDAEGIASRVQRMASALLAVDAKLGRLWPQFEMRAIRATDPGPVLELSATDLGRLIDRRGRFDPPQLPAPCGPNGYSFGLVGNVRPLVQWRRIDFGVRVGSINENFENTVRLSLYNRSEIWCDVDAGVRVVDALTDSWDADWCSAAGSVYDATDHRRVRHWLLWVRGEEGLRTFERRSPPPPGGAEQAAHRRGVLSTWP
jgi:hypothetical protein